MTAADRRRLTSALGVLCALLLLLLVSLWAGLGRGAHWSDDATAPRLASVHAAVPPPGMPPLQHFAVIWEHPLFSTDRKPAPVVAAGAADSGDLQLTGVIISPGLRMALLRERASGRTLRVREGQPIGHGGPVLIELKPRAAVIDTGGSRRELPLEVGPAQSGDAADNAPAPMEAGPMAMPAQTQATGRGTPNPVMSRTTRMQVGKVRSVQQKSAADTGQDATTTEARIKALKARVEQKRRQAARKQNDSGEQ